MSFLYFFFVSDSLTSFSLSVLEFCIWFYVQIVLVARLIVSPRFIPVFLLFYADPIPSIMSRMLSFLFIDTLHNYDKGGHGFLYCFLGVLILLFMRIVTKEIKSLHEMLRHLRQSYMV